MYTNIGLIQEFHGICKDYFFITHRCEPVARAGIDQGDEILVDVPHNGITEKEDRLLLKNTDRVGAFEEVRHSD